MGLHDRHSERILPTKIGECEAFCTPGNEGKKITERYKSMWFCDECWAKEQASTSVARPTPVTIDDEATRVAQLNSIVKEVNKGVDTTIEVRGDLFNADTQPILELKAAIDADTTITNKPYALGMALKDMFEHQRAVVFALNEQIVEAGNKQKAIQVYLNQMANTLRAEEREKLQIANLNYTPKPPKSIKPIKTTQTSKATKFDKVALRKYAMELGISEFTLQMVCQQKGITPETAANQLRRNIAEAKSMDSTPTPPQPETSKSDSETSE